MSEGDAPARADLVIRGANVIDGTGAARFRADVAISGDRIDAVGELSRVQAEVEIDADGWVLSPGFIDVHTHDDRALVETPDMSAKVSRGVTTVVAGNCGISLATLRLDRWQPPPMDLLGEQRWYQIRQEFVAYIVDSFDTLYSEGETRPAMMTIGLHARLLGRPGRIGALHEILDHLLAHDDVWICRRDEIARHWAEHHPFEANVAPGRSP